MDILEIPNTKMGIDFVLHVDIQSNQMQYFADAVILRLEENHDIGLKFMFNMVNPLTCSMTERMVEIPVYRQVREKIKSVKGTLSYSQFLQKILTEIVNKESITQ